MAGFLTYKSTLKINLPENSGGLKQILAHYLQLRGQCMNLTYFPFNPNGHHWVKIIKKKKLNQMNKKKL